MHNKIMPFYYGDDRIRVIQDENGDPWWMAKDVCDVLKLFNYRKAVLSLEDEEKGITKSNAYGDEQDLVTISDSGLYTLIIQSNATESKKFLRWIIYDVMPIIHRTKHHLNAGMDYTGFITDSTVRKSGNMYFPIAKLVEAADKFLEGEAALKALNFFTGMPVDDLLEKLENKKLKHQAANIDFRTQVFDAFISDVCVFGEHYQVSRKDLFKNYESYCQKNGCIAYSRENFFRELYSAIPSISAFRPRVNNPNREYCLKGIKMSTEVFS